MQKVVCSLCDRQYAAVMRACPECGQKNEACTAKLVMFQVELDESVLMGFRELARGREAECFQVAIEEWITQQRRKAG